MAARPLAERAGLDRNVLRIAAVVTTGAIMSILDATIVNIALESISSELHASLNTVQWAITGYLLALATVIPLAGWLSERFETKRVWMTSVAVFVTGSVLSGLSWSAGILILFRVLQGIGGGLIMPVGITVLTQAAGPRRVGRVMSVIGVPMLLGPVLGPVLGGVIIDNISWRWIFYVNVPVGALALVLAWRLLPSGTSGEAGRLDWRGFLLASPGVALLTFGLSESSSAGGFGAFSSWAPMAAGLVLLALFVIHGRRADNPLIDLRLFAEPGFASAAATVAVVGAALFGALILLPLFFQVARGENVLDAGLLLTPQGVGAAMMMPLAGSVTDRIGGGRVAVGGLILICLGTVPFVLVGAGTSLWWLEGGLAVRGLGLGATMMPAMSAAYASLERRAVPRATSALNTLQRVGGSLGTAVLAVILQGHLAAIAPHAARSGGELSAAQHISASARAHVAGPLAAAFGHTFAWALGFSAAALLPALILAWRGVRPNEEDARQEHRGGAEDGIRHNAPGEPERPASRRNADHGAGRTHTRRPRAGAPESAPTESPN